MVGAGGGLTLPLGRWCAAWCATICTPLWIRHQMRSEAGVYVHQVCCGSGRSGGGESHGSCHTRAPDRTRTAHDNTYALYMAVV